MKLSETGISAEQMKIAGRRHGVTWMGRDFDRTASDGELSSYVTSAIQSHGTGDLDTVFAAARTLQTHAQMESERAARAALGRVSWYNETVWVDGDADHALDRSATAQRLQSLGLITDGDTFHGAAKTVPDEVLNTLRAERGVVVEQINRAVNGALSRVQLWEPCEKCGAEPSYQTPRGHFCATHAQ